MTDDLNGDAPTVKRGRGRPKGHPNKGGQPRKLTLALISRVETLAARGMNQSQIASILNIGASTMSIWKRQKNEFQQKYTKALEKGAAIGLERRLKRIERHGKKSWQADAWWAERRFPLQFGKQNSVSISNADGTNVNSTTTVIAPTVVFVQPPKEEKLIGNGHTTEV